MEKNAEIYDKIQCYFFGESFGQDKLDQNIGLSGYAIPDFGIAFRSQCIGNLFQCQYDGLLSLLKFIDTNKKNFVGKYFEVLSDSAVIIYQINQKKFITKNLRTYYNAVETYKKKFPVKMSWVPKEDNIAIDGVFEVPPLKIEENLKLDFGIKDNPGLNNSNYIS